MEGNLIVVLGGVVRLYGVDSVVNSRVNADNFVVLACKNRHPSPICTQFERHFHALKPHLLCHSF